MYLHMFMAKAQIYRFLILINSGNTLCTMIQFYIDFQTQLPWKLNVSGIFTFAQPMSAPSFCVSLIIFDSFTKIMTIH